MKLSDLSKEDREFLESLALLKNTDRIGYLSVVCMIASITPTNQAATLSALKDTSNINSIHRHLVAENSLENPP